MVVVDQIHMMVFNLTWTKITANIVGPRQGTHTPFKWWDWTERQKISWELVSSIKHKAFILAISLSNSEPWYFQDLKSAL
jgi:hypothetical protein